MIWHDCKTDPPKKDGIYVLCFWLNNMKEWDCAEYFTHNNSWIDTYYYGLYDDYRIPYKWAEVDLSEVE